jgi:hypothetical protein
MGWTCNTQCEIRYIHEYLISWKQGTWEFGTTGIVVLCLFNDFVSAVEVR